MTYFTAERTATQSVAKWCSALPVGRGARRTRNNKYTCYLLLPANHWTSLEMCDAYRGGLAEASAGEANCGSHN
jgi:hypothetical protein